MAECSLTLTHCTLTPLRSFFFSQTPLKAWKAIESLSQPSPILSSLQNFIITTQAQVHNSSQIIMFYIFSLKKYDSWGISPYKLWIFEIVDVIWFSLGLLFEFQLSRLVFIRLLYVLKFWFDDQIYGAITSSSGIVSQRTTVSNSCFQPFRLQLSKSFTLTN